MRQSIIIERIKSTLDDKFEAKTHNIESKSGFWIMNGRDEDITLLNSGG